MIVPYKRRKLATASKVTVYRNLNKKGVWYSIKQRGVVIGHTDIVSLRDVTFHVNQKGRKRAVKTKRRNVHAWMEGFLTNYAWARIGKKMTKVRYNPFETKTFETTSGKKVTKARSAVLYSGGVIAHLV